MSTGKNIKDLRKQTGMSQQELADKLGVAKSTVACWETDRNFPKPDMQIKIASLFGVSLDRLNSLDWDCEIEYQTEKDARTEKVKMLVEISKAVTTDDLDRLMEYAEFLRSRRHA